MATAAALTTAVAVTMTPASVAPVRSSSSKTLATVAVRERTAQLWDVADTRTITSTASWTLAEHDGAVNTIAFSPDGRTLATSSADRTTRLRDISDRAHPRHLGTLAGHTDFLGQVTFSHDGSRVATVSGDHIIRRWDLDIDRVAERICDGARPSITSAVWNRYLPKPAMRLTSNSVRHSGH